MALELCGLLQWPTRISLDAAARRKDLYDSLVVLFRPLPTFHHAQYSYKSMLVQDMHSDGLNRFTPGLHACHRACSSQFARADNIELTSSR